MKSDFLDELGVIALGSRLKRLSDRMMADASAVYEHFGFEIQSKWFPLLSLLSARPGVTVVEAAAALGISQPAVSQFVRQLCDAGLAQVTTCERDARRRRIELSPTGESLIAELQPMWRAVHEAADALCREHDNDFYPALLALEAALERRSLLTRTCEAFEHANNRS